METKKKPVKANTNGVMKHRQRGTNDELEIIRLILLEHRGLYLKVMEKIRAYRTINNLKNR